MPFFKWTGCEPVLLPLIMDRSIHQALHRQVHIPDLVKNCQETCHEFNHAIALVGMQADKELRTFLFLLGKLFLNG